MTNSKEGLWRPIDTVPEDAGELLFAHNLHGYVDLRFVGADRAVYTYQGRMRPQPTHWMPLPQPPQEKTNDTN